MKAHIARNQNAGIPLALGWNLSAADRGILEGMAPAFGMKLLLVSPADAGKTVAQLHSGGDGPRFRDEAAAGLPCRCRQDRGPAAFWRGWPPLSG